MDTLEWIGVGVFVLACIVTEWGPEGPDKWVFVVFLLIVSTGMTSWAAGYNAGKKD